MKYYIAENGQPAGPFEPNELLMHGLTVNSLVWTEGMANWTSASQVPELAALLSGQTFNPGDINMQLPPMPPMGNQQPLPPMPQMPIPTGPTTPTTPSQPYNLPKTGPTTSNTGNNQPAPKTWFVESVIATLACSFCCGVPLIGLIPGAIAIFNAWGAKTSYASGDTVTGAKKASTARKWFFITVIVGIVCSIFGGASQLMNNPNIIQDIQNGNFSPFYGIP